jgi:predicted lipoprotein with Yx(FWY)xxD motif
MTRAVVATFCVGALLFAGCGGRHGSATRSSERASLAGGAAASGTTVKVVNSEFGRIVADHRGQAFYLFDREKSNQSSCYGRCAKRWPPVLAKGTPRAVHPGGDRLLGTTRRRDGALQLTYGGHPMYYYDEDRPGRVLCQKVDQFGGLWLVVKPDGMPVL